MNNAFPILTGAVTMARLQFGPFLFIDICFSFDFREVLLMLDAMRVPLHMSTQKPPVVTRKEWLSR
jgi:hypothetical protein